MAWKKNIGPFVITLPFNEPTYVEAFSRSCGVHIKKVKKNKGLYYITRAEYYGDGKIYLKSDGTTRRVNSWELSNWKHISGPELKFNENN